jgi:hypothetical protein
LNAYKLQKFSVRIPQFDLLCFGVLVWSLLLSLIILYFFMILTVLPSFVEVKKLRLKKISEDNLIKQTVIINKNLAYNLKLKKFSI